MLFVLIMEASRDSGWEDDVVTLKGKYSLKIPDHLLSASLEPWEEQGIVSVSRHSHGISAMVRRSKYGAALSTLMKLIDADTFEIDWRKEEIRHDATADCDWPGLPDWKQLSFERDRKASQGRSADGPVVIHNNFQPTMTQTVSTPLGGTGHSSSLWSAWGTWIGVAATILGIVATLYVSGKL